tara:strand:+ start:2761 stop:4740 length:1980 start_codon:yes stop_codon:yes gene_type:complete
MILIAPLALALAPQPAGLLASLASQDALASQDSPARETAPSTEPKAERASRQSGGQEVLALHMVDMEDMLSDPKDAALLAAFKMLPARLMELGNEIPGWDMPPQVVPMLTEVLSGSKTLTVHLDETMVPIPVRAQLNLHMGSAEAANTFHGRLYEMLSGTGAPFGEPEDGMIPLQLEPGMPPVLFGPRGNDFVVAFGEPDDAPFVAGNTGLPAGVKPQMVMRMDYGTMLGFMFDQMVPQEAYDDPEFQMVTDIMDMIGLDQIQFHMASGSDDTRSYSTFQMPGYGKFLGHNGLVSEQFVTENTLRLIPADAKWASAFMFDVSSCAEWVNELAGMALESEGIDDPIGMAGQMIGLDIRKDILDHIGTEMGVYASDSTGGGSLASMVFFMELADPDGIAPILDRVNEMIVGFGQAEAEGYLTSRAWSNQGIQYQSLSFPGLPVPIEPTYAIAGNHIFFGASPQATMGAVRQAMKPTTSLLNNAHFLAQMPGSLENVIGLDFMDTPALLADGYFWSNMLFTAIGNGVRSPHGAVRDPGPILPAYGDLMKGARAMVNITSVEGEDLVVRGVGDRSMCVQLTGFTGFLSSSGLGMLLPLVFLGIAESNNSFGSSQAWEPEMYEYEYEMEIEDEPIIEDHEVEDHEGEDHEHGGEDHEGDGGDDR